LGSCVSYCRCFYLVILVMKKQTRKEKIDALVADSFTNNNRRKCTLLIT
jgi:hypothetical protein